MDGNEKRYERSAAAANFSWPRTGGLLCWLKTLSRPSLSLRAATSAIEESQGGTLVVGKNRIASEGVGRTGKE